MGACRSPYRLQWALGSSSSPQGWIIQPRRRGRKMCRDVFATGTLVDSLPPQPTCNTPRMPKSPIESTFQTNPAPNDAHQMFGLNGFFFFRFCERKEEKSSRPKHTQPMLDSAIAAIVCVIVIEFHHVRSMVTYLRFSTCPGLGKIGKREARTRKARERPGAQAIPAFLVRTCCPHHHSPNRKNSAAAQRGR